MLTSWRQSFDNWISEVQNITHDTQASHWCNSYKNKNFYSNVIVWQMSISKESGTITVMQQSTGPIIHWGIWRYNMLMCLHAITALIKSGNRNPSQKCPNPWLFDHKMSMNPLILMHAQRSQNPLILWFGTSFHLWQILKYKRKYEGSWQTNKKLFLFL